MSTSVFFYEPFYDFDRLVDHAFSLRGAGQSDVNAPRRDDGVFRSLKPRMDLHENTQTNTVTATFELPGLKKEDVNIETQDGRLTVSAESRFNADSEDAGSGYAVRERRFGKIVRTLQVPQGVKDEDIKASMENGVLTVTFPKTVPELAPKKITIV